jgi:hypothetical protein
MGGNLVGKSNRSFRTTITVPQDLKRRMDAIKERVNWSALACKAFEEKLAEIASKKGRKTMDDVIQRLRGSKQQMESEDRKAGETAGQAWAKDQAEARELENLEKFLDGLDHQPRYGRGEFFSDYGSSAYSNAELLYFKLHPEAEDDRDGAENFWVCALGDDKHQAESDDFLRGFAEGAEAIWLEVKKQL